jgi:hypothetical protein
MAVLYPLIGEMDEDVQTLRARLEAARQRYPQAKAAAT